jgi:MoaA/NifB/PqqE/SkfB family radical SAM enzyme
MVKISEFFGFLVRPRFDWLQIEVAGVCNAACAYCVLTCYQGMRQGGLMEMETFERLAPHFSRAALVFLQGWGEPLLHPQFWEMARRAKASGAQVGFTTNGTRLGRENLAQLLDIPIDIMGVSIAGTTAATSDRWRHGCDFVRLGSALNELQRMKGARSGQPTRVHLAYMLFASSWRELEALPALAEAWGASEVVVSNLSFIPDPALQQESLFERSDLWPPVLDLLETVREQAAARGIALYYYRPDAREPHALCTEHVLNACFVSWQGDVAPCVMTNQSIKPGSMPTHYFRGRSHPVESCVLGNVNEKTFDAIWDSAEARAFRAAFARRQKRKHPGTDDLPAPCRHCYKLYEP